MKTNIQNLKIMVDYNRFKIEEFLEQFQLDETVLIYTIEICYWYNNMFPRSAQIALEIVANLTGNDYDYGVLEALSRSFIRFKDFSNVDFPHPEGPINAVISFSGICMEIFFSA